MLLEDFIADIPSDCYCHELVTWECAGICFISEDNRWGITPDDYPMWTKCPCGEGEFLQEPCDYCIASMSPTPPDQTQNTNKEF